MTKKSTKEKDVIDQILDQLDLHGMTQEELFGADGLAKRLTSRLLNKALEAEMDTHLGYRKHSSEGDGSGNSRNGYSEKTVITGDGEAQIKVPRDRNGEFEPEIVKKHYLDAVRVNSRESGKSVNKALYIALAITMEGRKEVLGFYLSDNEGAKFWMGVLDGRAYGPEEPRSAGHTHRLHGWAHGLP